MLDPVAELSENALRDIRRTLGHEIDTHALAPDKPHDLLDLVSQRLRRVVKEHVSLIEEEHQLRKIHVADLRKC